MDAYYFRFHTDVECIPHLHVNNEFIYVKSGRLRVTVNGRAFLLSAGEAVLVLPYEVHDMHTAGESVALVSEFSPDTVSSFTQLLSHKEAEERKFVPDTRVMEYLLQGIEKENVSLCEAKAYFYFICTEFLKNSPLKEKSLRSVRNYVYNAIVYINEHYREELSLQSVAEAVGCSYNYLSKAFFEEVGIRFSQYVNNYRMQKAVYLLLNGETSVTDIAYETGFSSVRNFNRIFLAAMGTSPTEFRKRESPEVYNL